MSFSTAFTLISFYGYKNIQVYKHWFELFVIILHLLHTFLQVSRSIGDAYLKDAEFNCEPLMSRFRIPESFRKPILSPEPSIVTHKLSPEDQFLIFASDGLWEHLSNQEAVNIIHNSPRNVSCLTFSYIFLLEL